ncbi:hypothetical protein [Emticicia sp. C21]|uniref:AbiU2 domain-containing protein n=1 Tax=Emticicia sp. C21 TaxID=2302915 RepID=UPI000E34546D|nr:hypothetical protein [Emticicia sp. C21]RFS17100.1 hypothetical protein D0T08_10525 [Emticicia sp. C21]
MSPELRKIEEILYEIGYILIDAKANFQYCYFLNVPGSIEREQYLGNSYEFRFIRYNHWKMCIIDLSKLYDKKTDAFRLVRLFEEIKKSLDKGILKFDYSFLDDWENKLNTYKDLIDKIKIRRDKFYAHTAQDREKYDFISKIEFEEIRKIIDFTEKIIKDIFHKVLDTEYLIRDLHFKKERFTKIIDVLVIEKAVRIKKLTDNIVNRK